MWRLGNEQFQTFCTINDYSHNIIGNHVPLASLAFHMHMDDDFFVRYVSLPGHIHNLSGARAETWGNHGLHCQKSPECQPSIEQS